MNYFIGDEPHGLVGVVRCDYLDRDDVGLKCRERDEIGLDLSKEFPKPLTTEVVKAADVVVTTGLRRRLPILPGKRYLDWELPDPRGKPVEEVRSIRDEIDSRVRTLLSELVPA